MRFFFLPRAFQAVFAAPPFGVKLEPLFQPVSENGGFFHSFFPIISFFFFPKWPGFSMHKTPFSFQLSPHPPDFFPDLFLLSACPPHPAPLTLFFHGSCQPPLLIYFSAGRAYLTFGSFFPWAISLFRPMLEPYLLHPPLVPK